MTRPAPATSRPAETQSANDSVQLAIRGMTCAACVGRVERALRKVPGVTEAQVNFAIEQAAVRWSPGPGRAGAEEACSEVRPSEADLLAAVARAGYEAQVLVPDAPLALEEADSGRDTIAVALGLAASMPLMLPMLWGDHHFWPAWLQFLLSTPVQFGLGARFYRAGWAALRQGSGNMDQLVALGTSAAWGLSVWLWWSHGHGGHAPALYFESSAVVITLVLLGKALETRARHQTSQAIRGLQALRPEVAHRIGPQGEVTVPVSQILPNDLLVVRPGERIPADGKVESGHSHVDEALLTGEPMPRPCTTGDSLTGGAINGEGVLHMRVTAVGAQTVLSAIVRRVFEAQAAKAPVQRLVDRVSGVFVPVVLVLALATGLGWWWSGLPPEAALMRAVAVLVIACPCALGLATPAAIMAGTGAAARHGILIQDPQALELAHRVQVVALDKTGTLTEGRPRLNALALPGGQAWTAQALAQASPDDADVAPARELLAVAAGLQRHSEHPLAKAVREASAAMALDPRHPALQAQEVQAVPGRGLEGWVQGRRWALASTGWARALLQSQALPEALSTQAQAWAEEGATVSWLLSAQRPNPAEAIEDVQSDARTASCAAPWVVQGVLAFADALKPEARAAVAELQSLGVRVVMLTGDQRAAALHVAQQLGVSEVVAEVLPNGKADEVRRLQQGPGGERVAVAMAGDGLNDAPALAAADIGLAMANPGGGTDVAMQAAGITLMRGDLRLVAAAIDISRRTTRRIWQNLGWAFGYNLVGIPLAALGGLSPMLAGAAMAFSSVSVVLNALWLSRWSPRGGAMS